MMIACILSDTNKLQNARNPKKKVHQYPENYKTSIAYN
jgi:hypothetical protein